MPLLAQTLGVISTAGRAHGKVPGRQVASAYGLLNTSGRARLAIHVPPAAFDDFALFGLSDPDPAMVIVGTNNGGTQSGGYGAAYARQYMIFTPPKHYAVSGGGKAWSRAAFAGLGFKYTGITAGNWQYLEDVQLEESALARTTPLNYESPRRIQVKVKPTRLNFFLNPSIEVSVANWFRTDATVTTTKITSDHHGAGTSSMQVAMTATGKQVFASPTGLIPGRTYTASIWTKVVNEVPGADLTLTLTNGTRVSGQNYAQSGIQDINGWVRIWITFVATSSTVSVRITSPTIQTFLVDEALLEEGTALRDYFDGGNGDDYLWESGGTVGLARSYYYEQRRERAYLVQRLLDENTPVGITNKDPDYAILPTQ